MTDSLRELPRVERKAGKARSAGGRRAERLPAHHRVRPAVHAGPDGLPLQVRPRSPSYYDANGHYARVSTAEAEPLPLLHAGRHELAVHQRRRALRDRASWRRSRPASSSTTSSSGPSPAARAAPRQPIAGSNPFTDDGNLLTGGQRPNPKCDTSDVPRGHEADRRRSLGAPGARPRWSSSARRRAGSGGGYEVRAIFDNGDFLVPGEDGAGRRRQRRIGRLGGRDDAGRRPGVHHGRQRRDAGQGGRGDDDHRRRLPGLPPGRLLPDPSAVAARREVHRLRAHPATAARAPAATPADGDPRRPAGRRRALPAAREQRQGGRPRPGQQHHARAIRRPLPADPQRPRRRAGGPRARTSTRSSSAPTRRCGRPTGSSPSSPRRTSTLGQARRQLRHRSWPRSPASASTSPGSSTTPTRPRQATAERSQDLEAGFQKFPGALHELRLTMAKLRGFSDQATPVFSEFRAGAPGDRPGDRGARPVRSSGDAVADLAGHRRRGEQAAARQLRPDPIEDPRPREEGRARRQEPRRPPHEPAQDGGYKQLTKFLFNTTGGDQRLRPVRPLPPRRAADHPAARTLLAASSRFV